MGSSSLWATYGLKEDWTPEFPSSSSSGASSHAVKSVCPCVSPCTYKERTLNWEKMQICCKWEQGKSWLQPQGRFNLFNLFLIF